LVLSKTSAAVISLMLYVLFPRTPRIVAFDDGAQSASEIHKPIGVHVMRVESFIMFFLGPIGSEIRGRV